MAEANAVTTYIEKSKTLLDKLRSGVVLDIVNELQICLNNGGKILLCGNGGSAADASHFAGELVVRFRRNRRPLAAVALTVDPAVITAISNDFGYENVFSRQIEALGNTGDVLLAITTSGKSSNVVKAAYTAREKGLRVVAFTSKLSEAVDWADIHWMSTSGATSFTQEQMLVVFHAISHSLEDSIEPGQ